MITGPEAGITRDSISHRLACGRTSRCGWSTPRACASAPRSRTSSRNCRRGTRKRAIDHAEVVVLLLDATRGLEVQDLKIADQVLEEGRRWSSRSTNGTSPNMPRRCSTGSRRRSRKGSPAEGRAAADRFGQDRQGHRPAARRGVRGARELVAAGVDRRAQPLVRTGGRDQSAARAGRQADQAALHHPGEVAAAELRRVRNAGRPAADKLSSATCSIRCAATWNLGPVPLRLTMRAPKNPLRQRQGGNNRLLYPLGLGMAVEPRPDRGAPRSMRSSGRRLGHR